MLRFNLFRFLILRGHYCVLCCSKMLTNLKNYPFSFKWIKKWIYINGQLMFMIMIPILWLYFDNLWKWGAYNSFILQVNSKDYYEIFSILYNSFKYAPHFVFSKYYNGKNIWKFTPIMCHKLSHKIHPLNLYIVRKIHYQLWSTAPFISTWNVWRFLIF